jgi:hypothetical protein
MIRFLARFVAVLCVIVFVLLTVAVVFLQAAGTRFLQPPIYKSALLKERFYERVPRLAAEMAARGVPLRLRAATDGAQEAFDLLAQLTPADWERLVGAIAPATYLRAQGESGLDQLADCLHSGASTLSVEISLVELKRNLAGPETEAAYVAMLQAKPPGTSQQVEEAGGLPIGFRPPTELMPRVREYFGLAMRSLSDRLPDAFDPFTRAAAFGDIGRVAIALTDARETLLQIERWARRSPLLPAALLLLIALLAVRSLRGCLLWWGIPCFLAGAAAAAMALPVVPMARWIFAAFVVPHFPPAMPAEIVQTSFGLMTAVIQEVMAAALTSAGILAGAGLLCLLLACFCKRRVAPAVAPKPGP